MVAVSPVNTVYERYGRSVYRRACKLLGDPEAAKDATQEVFMRVMRLDEGDGLGSNPLAWLYRATTNLCLNWLRDARRRRAIMSSRASEEATLGDPDARVIVRRILREVPEYLQDIAVYYYVDELSHDEIAEIIGVSRRTVGHRLSAFHKHIGDSLAREART
jgi:RNA polymerase sigma-70 factor (ECF subfamily)